jgi:hypothetical protein
LPISDLNDLQSARPIAKPAKRQQVLMEATQSAFRQQKSAPSTPPVALNAFNAARVNVTQIQINLAVQSLLSLLRKVFPIEGHFLKLCTMTRRRCSAGQVTALSGAMQILGQFQHFEL